MVERIADLRTAMAAHRAGEHAAARAWCEQALAQYEACRQALRNELDAARESLRFVTLP